VAILERDSLCARREIALGFAAIDGREAPLAEWRLHALAGDLLDDPSLLAQARTAILQLASSIQSAIFSTDQVLGRQSDHKLWRL
jgi:hypothetical protein